MSSDSMPMPDPRTPKAIDVVILCGGQGTRLRSVAQSQKVMVPTGNRPFLSLLLQEVAEQGFKRFVLCTGYKGETVRDFFSRVEVRPDIVYSQEKSPQGTAGALREAEKQIQGDPFLVMNGDSLCRMNLKDVVHFHQQQKALATLVVVKPFRRKDGGYVKLDERNRILSFDEKKYDSSLYMNAGIYVFDRSFLQIIPRGRAVSLEKEVFPSLLQKGVYAYLAEGLLYDIGTPERLTEFRSLNFEYTPQSSSRNRDSAANACKNAPLRCRHKMSST